MGSSLACGINALSVETEGALIALCDQWQLEKSDYQALLDAWIGDISDIHLSEWFDDKSLNSGPPAIFPRKHFPELISLNSDRGARVVAMRHSAAIQRVRIQNAVSDLDQPADLDRLNQEPEKS